MIKTTSLIVLIPAVVSCSCVTSSVQCSGGVLLSQVKHKRSGQIVSVC